MFSSTLKSGREIEIKLLKVLYHGTASSFGVYFVGISLIYEFPGYKEKQWIELCPMYG
jgi:hypothetical protein